MTDRPRHGVPVGASGDSDGADRYALWDAAYVLGSLSSVQRHEYEDHLAGCKSCRAAVGELSGVPALLAMLTSEEVAAIGDDGRSLPPEHPEPPHQLSAVMNAVHRKRRRAQWTTWSTAAAAAITLTVALTFGLRGALTESTRTGAAPMSSGPGNSLTMTPVVQTALEATVSVSGQPWGTSVEMTCTYHEESKTGPDGDDGDRLTLVAVGHDGSKTSLATWIAIEGRTAYPRGSTALPVEQIASLQIIADQDGKVLLQRNL